MNRGVLPGPGANRVALLLVGLAASFLVPGPLIAQPEPAGFAHVHQIDAAVASVRGRTIRIENPYGNVRVRSIPAAGAGSIRITLQSRSEDVMPARLDSSECRDGPLLQIVAEHPELLVRADVVVALPDRAAIDIELEQGDFTMHPASYPVKVRARRGEISLRTIGRVDVEVSEGRVVYNPPVDAAWSAPAGGRIRTSGAPVDVLAGVDAGLNYRVVSGAAVTTDSPELLETRRREGRAVLFGGRDDGYLLDIRTDHAPVRLVAEGNR